jgi:hypothetical protein
MLKINKISRRDLMILILILFVAALMRFGQAGIVEFFHDDAMLSSLAQDMVAGKDFPFTGINSSVGIPNPPTSVYVMALPFSIDSNPITAIVFIMGLNVIGVGLLWLIAHRYFGKTAALVAGFAYAINPWAVLYSRKIWAQDFHTPIILLGLFLGLYGFWEAAKRSEMTYHSRWLKPHEWAQALCLPILLFGFQIHFAAWALLPLFVVLIVIGWQRISWRAMFISIILVVIVMTPYAIGFYHTWQENPGQVRPGVVGKLADDSQFFSFLSLRYLSYLATGFGLETWLAPAQQEEMMQAVPSISLWVIIGGMILIGTILLPGKKWRLFAPLLLIWAYLPALALIPQWAGVYPHYFIASIPALMLLAGIGVAWIAKVVPLKSFGRTIVLGAFALILLTQGIYWRAVLRFVEQTEIQYPGFTVPIHYLQDVEAELAAYDDVVILSDGMAWDLHHESVVWSVMLHDTAQCVRTLIGDGYAVFPNGEFAALQAPNMPENGIGKLYFSDEAIHIAERPNGNGYMIYRWDNAPEWQGTAISAIDAAHFEGDVWLTGYGIDDSAIVLEWTLPATNPDLNYQYSIQAFNSNQEKIAQFDTQFWQGRHWCTGDRLLTWVWETLPPETAQIYVFLYRLGKANEPRYINANVLDEMGNPMNDHAVIVLP